MTTRKLRIATLACSSLFIMVAAQAHTTDQQPDVVFADEPTGNLDSANAKELHNLFFELRKKFNQTFLIVTHNEELAQLSDRILHMKDGKII